MTDYDDSVGQDSDFDPSHSVLDKNENHSGEDDSSDSDSVLSEVHISPQKPTVVGHQKNRFVSQFPISWPSENSQLEKLSQSTSVQQPIFDNDGDLIVPRKPLFRETILVTHALSTPLHSVGLQVWRGALLLGDFILYNESKFVDCFALELGAGSGFVGIVLARVAKKVYLTDHNIEVLQNCRQNVHLNEHLFRNQRDDYDVASVRHLDWTEPDNPPTSSQTTQQPSIPEEFLWTAEDDLIKVNYLFAADVIYDNALTLALFDKLRAMAPPRRLMTPEQTLFLSLEKRINFTIDDLKPTAKAYDYFRSLLNNETTNVTPATTSKFFVAQQIPIDFPQYFSYDRTKELELWEIKYK